MTRVGEEVTCTMMTHTAPSPGSIKLFSITIYSDFFLSPEHTKYIFNCLYFIPIGLGARKMTAGTEKKRESAVYVWCDQILRAACTHLNTPLSHWTNKADGSTVACLQDYTIITGFTNISPPHAAPSLSHHLSHITQFPGLLWHVKCTPPRLIRTFQAMQYRILFN